LEFRVEIFYTVLIHFVVRSLAFFNVSNTYCWLITEGCIAACCLQKNSS